jgi:aspartate racemase
MIGILSGMGAAAGAYFHTRLIKACQRAGAKRDCEFPEIIHYSMATTASDEKGIHDFTLLKEVALTGVKVLNNGGADLIVIACNTLHYFYDFLQSHSKAEILNLIKTTKEKCNGGYAGLISSRTTRDFNLYSNCFYLSDEDQEIVDEIINRAIGGGNGLEDQGKIYAIIRKFYGKSEKVILGCTELSMIMPPIINVIDPVDVIIEELTRRIYGK